MPTQEKSKIDYSNKHHFKEYLHTFQDCCPMPLHCLCIYYDSSHQRVQSNISERKGHDKQCQFEYQQTIIERGEKKKGSTGSSLVAATIHCLKYSTPLLVIHNLWYPSLTPIYLRICHQPSQRNLPAIEKTWGTLNILEYNKQFTNHNAYLDTFQRFKKTKFSNKNCIKLN